jgi:septal ring factor EnvC (AmiA/AmiB activator)
MKELNSTQDAKVKRILIVSAILVFVCIVCIFVSIRYADKYWIKVAETSKLEQKLDDLEQDVKKLDMKSRELEFVRYDLSLEKEQIGKEYSIIKERYKSLGKTIKSLEKDIRGLQKILKFVETYKDDPLIDNEESSEKEFQLLALQSRNVELVNELAVKTKEKMILQIALESQAKRLGLSENYDPELKGILKNFITSLQ